MISSLWNDRVRSEVVYSNMCCRENRTVRDRGTQLMNDWTVYHPACPTACQQEELKKEKIHEILSVQDLNYHLYQSVLWEGSLTQHMRVICSVGERRTNWHSPVPPECQWKGDRRTVYYPIQWYTNMNISSWQRFTIVMHIYTVWGKVWSKELWISIWSLEIEKKRAIQIVLQFYYGSEGTKRVFTSNLIEMDNVDTMFSSCFLWDIYTSCHKRNDDDGFLFLSFLVRLSLYQEAVDPKMLNVITLMNVLLLVYVY